MTRENFTSINVIIDASGSMNHLATDTIGNFNSFLAEQKACPGEAVLTLCTFNTTSNLVHDFVKLDSIPDLSAKSYKPSGGTALLDAMGSTMESVGKRLAAMAEEDRPSKVIFLIITDGHENSSNDFDSAQIKTMVEHQKDVYSWEFVFMGANIDAIAAGTNLGISTQNTMNYSATPAGTHDLYKSVSTNMRSYRASRSSKADFFQDQSTPTIVGVDGTPVTPVTPVVPPTNGSSSNGK
jgi:uncharacterized protein YegL